MFFERANAKALVRESISKSVITILVSEAGSGKSRLIDSLFEFDGDFDTSHAALIRLDERVTDRETLAQHFATALDHRRLPDDLDYRQFLIASINKLNPSIIVIDNIHVLSEDPEALRFLHYIINESGVYESLPNRRWLLASRSINDFPHNRWIPDRKCGIITEEISLTPEETGPLEKFLSLQKNTLSGKLPRQITLGYAALRALRSLPHDIIQKNRIVSSTQKRIRHDSVVQDLLSILKPEISDSILASSFAYNLNPDILIDLIPNIDDVIRVLQALDLAFFDVAAKHVRIDASFRSKLHQQMLFAPDEILYTAVKVACELRANFASVERALMTLVELERWEILIDLLGEYGIDLIDRYSSYQVINDIIRHIPKQLADSRPEIQGLKGILTTIDDQGDTSEGWLRLAIENESVREPFRSKILYRYCIELKRRKRSDAGARLQELMASIYEHNSGGDALKALAHSFTAVVVLHESQATALGHIDMAERLLKNTDDPFAYARVYFDIAYALDDMNEGEKALRYLGKCVDICVEHGFFDIAARAMAHLHVSAYNTEHNIPRALHYARCMEKYAEKSGDARTKTVARLARYWIAVEAGLNDEIEIDLKDEVELELQSVEESMADGISRYRATDDYMQLMVRCTIVPGAGMIIAESGDYAKATSRIETYAINEKNPTNRASLWTFLALYYAADYALLPNAEKKQKYVRALRETRIALRTMDGVVAQEGDLAFRMLLSLYLMDRHGYLRRMFPYLSELQSRDHRAPAMKKMITALLEMDTNGNGLKAIQQALRELHEMNMGGIARIIRFLPLPLSRQSMIPTPKPLNPYVEV